MIPLTVQEVAENLNPSEFIQLCSAVDKQFGKRIKNHSLLGSGWNDNQMQIAERSKEVKFDIYAIEKARTAMNVLIDFGKGAVVIPVLFKQKTKQRVISKQIA